MGCLTHSCLFSLLTHHYLQALKFQIKKIKSAYAEVLKDLAWALPANLQKILNLICWFSYCLVLLIFTDFDDTLNCFRCAMVFRTFHIDLTSNLF